MDADRKCENCYCFVPLYGTDQAGTGRCHLRPLQGRTFKLMMATDQCAQHRTEEEQAKNARIEPYTFVMNSDPDDDVGFNGDFWLNALSGDVWRKENDTWS